MHTWNIKRPFLTNAYWNQSINIDKARPIPKNWNFNNLQSWQMWTFDQICLAFCWGILSSCKQKVKIFLFAKALLQSEFIEEHHRTKINSFYILMHHFQSPSSKNIITGTFTRIRGCQNNEYLNYIIMIDYLHKKFHHLAS